MYLKELISKENLEKRINEMACKIDDDYNEKELIVICILRGAVYFCTDLTKNMKTKMKLDFMQVSSYDGEESTGKINIKKDIEYDIEGKDVLIVEDIIDTGTTLKNVKEYLKSKNPNSLKIAVLIDKPARRKVNVDVDYVGFEVPNKFLVGFGFDNDEYDRNVDFIGYIE